MNDFLPKRLCVGVFGEGWVFAVDGELLVIGFSLHGAVHEFVVNFHADVGAGDFSFHHFGVDEVLSLRVFDADGEHQCSASSVLCHLACGVAVAFHEGNDTCGGECGVFDG